MEEAQEDTVLIIKTYRKSVSVVIIGGFAQFVY